jgi:adenosylcobinamide-GDP ribazoletransferase
MKAGLKKQWVLLCYALSFFSRAPIPRSIDYKAFPFYLGNTYFPLVGAISAVIGFIVYFVAQPFFDNTISIILMLVASVLFTGGLHEDGFADSCDGFGGGYNKKQCLAIMKDSQIGAYGVIGLILLFTLKIHLLTNLSSHSPTIFLCVLISSAMLSRLSLLGVIQYTKYARDGEVSKAANSSHRLPLNYLLIAILLSLLSMWWMPLLWFLVILAMLILSTYLCRFYFNRQIQGYTGDCLGFLQQLNEILIFLILLPLFDHSLFF